MAYEMEEIAKELKQARENKGLSQRALSSLADVPQSHLSKVENGNVDIRLSSLTQIARALDLEVKLVPKKALPAVETVVRSTSTQTTEDQTRRALNKLSNAEILTNYLRSNHPNSKYLDEAGWIIDDLKRNKFKNENFAQLSNILIPFDEISNNLNLYDSEFKKSENRYNTVSGNLKNENEIKSVIRALKRFRNQIVHERQSEPSKPSPAYSLEEDDDA